MANMQQRPMLATSDVISGTYQITITKLTERPRQIDHIFSNPGRGRYSYIQGKDGAIEVQLDLTCDADVDQHEVITRLETALQAAGFVPR